MKLYSRIIAICLLASFTMIEAACPQTPYGKAASVGLNITNTLHTGADTVDRLRLNGTLSVAEERTAMQWMDKINDLDISYGQCIQAAHAASSATQGLVDCGETFVTSMQQGPMLADLNIVNPTSKMTVIQIGIAVVALMDTTVAAIQGIK